MRSCEGPLVSGMRAGLPPGAGSPDLRLARKPSPRTVAGPEVSPAEDDGLRTAPGQHERKAGRLTI